MTSGAISDADTPPLENPFVQRTRITDATRFAGRWRELSLIFDAIEARRPVMVTGPASIGKSSLLTHITASAAVHLEEPLLPSFYLALHEASTPEDVYQTVLQALGIPGSTPSALEVALLEQETPVLLCLDDAHRALNAGWGETLLDTLARIARGGQLLLVAASAGEMPLLSERFVGVRMGAFAPAEVRLFAETYLEGTNVSFTPGELRVLASISAGHPAYLQRAAYHLFESRRDGRDWCAAFLAEARERPIPGAPLPPESFEGGDRNDLIRPRYGTLRTEKSPRGVTRFPIPEAPHPLLLMIVPLSALLSFVITGNIVTALLVVLPGLAIALAWWYRCRVS
ncbi:ATP-binding protein [Roseiflexus sp.]|uniref:ATP-binding protein n=1 Tax=Roseiflexus sp. TaxID=2562120 RepID=UPI00398A60D4